MEYWNIEVLSSILEMKVFESSRLLKSCNEIRIIQISFSNTPTLHHSKKQWNNEKAFFKPLSRGQRENLALLSWILYFMVLLAICSPVAPNLLSLFWNSSIIKRYSSFRKSGHRVEVI